MNGIGRFGEHSFRPVFTKACCDNRSGDKDDKQQPFIERCDQDILYSYRQQGTNDRNYIYEFGNTISNGDNRIKD
ncbi:Hypp8638 [Branchiostoma lanceolatum]|uniref:Hypp8638 protein n=1 Tax=Branchiostoma lanceolatum TaxID=7740 RepID=A0A8J9Z818_BRALA|nr:Hypp8638 [Branchiostoma lanceolatum]